MSENWREQLSDLMSTGVCNFEAFESFIMMVETSAEKRGFDKACDNLCTGRKELIQVLKYAQQDLLNFRKLVFEMWALGDKLPKACHDLTMELHNANCGPLDRHIKDIIKSYEEETK